MLPSVSFDSPYTVRSTTTVKARTSRYAAGYKPAPCRSGSCQRHLATATKQSIHGDT